MALQLYLHNYNRRGLQRQRIFRDRTQPLEIYSDIELYQRYRFTRLGCLSIIDRLQAQLEHPTNRSRALSPSSQVFIALRFYASGSKSALAECASLHGCSKSSASRALRRVTTALVNIRHEEIKFPTTPAAVAAAQREFFQVAGFPQVVGAVDGTLIGLHGCYYGPDEYVYVSRKGRHAINVQLICNAQYKIINVVARWPGSTHDSRILRESLIGQQFSNQQLQGLLLGDSGYPLLSWLMTPILNPTTAEEAAYNK